MRMQDHAPNWLVAEVDATLAALNNHTGAVFERNDRMLQTAALVRSLRDLLDQVLNFLTAPDRSNR